MKETSRKQIFRLGFCYGVHGLSLFWLIWIAVEISYLQGWYEAQGAHHTHQGVELSLAITGVGLLSVFPLIHTEEWYLPPIIAILVSLVWLTLWIGATR